jgi:hypothetical protein
MSGRQRGRRGTILRIVVPGGAGREKDRRTGLRQRLAQPIIPFARIGENDVPGHDLGALRPQVAGDAGMDIARIGPATQQRLQVAQRVFIDVDHKDPAEVDGHCKAAQLPVRQAQAGIAHQGQVRGQQGDQQRAQRHPHKGKARAPAGGSQGRGPRGCVSGHRGRPGDAG